MTGHRTKVSNVQVKDGKLVRVKQYRSKNKALKTARLAKAWKKAWKQNVGDTYTIRTASWNEQVDKKKSKQ